MNHKAIVKTVLILAVAFSVLLTSAVPAFAQGASELLEKGIYLEETVGRLGAAIEIYRRIENDATASRAQVAEALLRLGRCQQKQGDSSAAVAAFERIVADFPEQEPFVAQARELLGEDKALELLPAPWADGEVTRMTLKLASGTPIGAFLMAVDAAVVDDEELWRLRARQRTFSDSDNQAARQVLVQRATMAPVTSGFEHTVLGHFEARYGKDKVTIDTIGGGTTREQPIKGQVFDGEELYQLLRRLPLEVGFKETLHLIWVRLF